MDKCRHGEGVVSQIWMPVWKKNCNYHICKHLHFCLANHACVSHLRRAQPHLLECYYWNFIIGTHMCTSSIRMISFCTRQCELSTSCNISNNASLVSVWTGGGVGQPNVDRPGQRRRPPKNSQICTDILYGWTLRGKKCYWLVYAKHLPVILSLFPSAVRI